MDVAIIGAGGVCGRQLLFQTLSQRIVSPDARIELVTHRGGQSEREMWGLRGDAADAFDEIAPTLDIVFDPHQITAGVVVVLAGATISTDPNVPADRTALAATNTAMFTEYAEALAARDHPPIVVVQSNPVELGVKIFSRRLPRRSVLGAAGFSDSLRFGREVARDLGVARRDVRALVLGEHGDRMVPLWSQLQVRGRDAAEYAEQVRAGRQLSDLPDEIRARRRCWTS